MGDAAVFLFSPRALATMCASMELWLQTIAVFYSTSLSVDFPAQVHCVGTFVLLVMCQPVLNQLLGMRAIFAHSLDLLDKTCQCTASRVVKFTFRSLLVLPRV